MVPNSLRLGGSGRCTRDTLPGRRVIGRLGSLRVAGLRWTPARIDSEGQPMDPVWIGFAIAILIVAVIAVREFGGKR